jgi:serine/threonine-protein kinase HipA
MNDKNVNVYLSESLAGVLSVDEYGILVFRYDKQYLESKGQALSCSLPLQSEEYSGGAAHNFFSGLLPEEAMGRAMADAIGTDENNRFRLLVELGKESIGALRIGDITATEMHQYTELLNSDLQKVLAHREELMPEVYLNENVRLSLAGAQSKIGLLLKNNTYFLPLDGAPSNVIVKPTSSRFETLTTNEFLTMKIASQMGIGTPKVNLMQAGNQEFYCIERYDRLTTNSTLTRIHQEDFCQALGISSQNKYEQDGGPSFPQCVDLIRRVCQVPGHDIIKLLRLFIFNLLIGNRDAHGKNYSLLHDKKNVRLAPAYDLVNTQMYPLASTSAMSVNSQFEVDLITKNDWVAMFSESNINPSMSIREYVKMKADLPSVIREQITRLKIETTFGNEYYNNVVENLSSLRI